MSEIILDSLAPVYLKLIPTEIPKQILDLGCGSGIPVIPLAMVLPLSNLLGVDSSVKRIQYADSIRRDLMIENLKFVSERIEIIGSSRKGTKQITRPPKSLLPFIGKTDFVMARGMAKPIEVMGYAEHYLAPKGRLIIFSTESAAENTRQSITPHHSRRWWLNVHPYTRSGSDLPYTLMDLSLKS